MCWNMYLFVSDDCSLLDECELLVNYFRTGTVIIVSILFYNGFVVFVDH